MRGRLGVAAIGALVALVASACDGDEELTRIPVVTLPADPGSAPSSPPTPTTEPPPYESVVQLDPAGRPYDAEHVAAGTTSETRPAGAMHFPGGVVLVLDGNAVEVNPAFFAADANEVRFDVEDLALSIVWERVTDGGQARESILGVRLDVPGTTVTRWGRFEPGYATDGGSGGVIGTAVIEVAGGLEEEAFLIPDRSYGSGLELRDLDPLPGDDTLVFSNGFGDGAFPMVRGFDADGRLVSLVVWETRFHWRVAIPDGAPPPDVTEREEEIRACLDGERALDELGGCPSG